MKSMLGSGFIRADRATLVSIKGIHAIGKEIELVNGETLYYSCRKKRELKEQLRAGRRQIAQSLSDSDAPTTQEEYQRHYASYDSAPFAFTDIEMVFNEERAAVDWIFRYGNEALERVLAELAEIAFADLGAEPAPPVKVGDKLRALELIYKYLGLGDGAAAEEPVVIVDEAPTEQEVTP